MKKLIISLMALSMLVVMPVAAQSTRPMSMALGAGDVPDVELRGRLGDYRQRGLYL